jgi:hypothetical protein
MWFILMRDRKKTMNPKQSAANKSVEMAEDRGMRDKSVDGPNEQPTISILFKRAAIMPDGSMGAVLIGEFAGDRSKDLCLTIAQAQTLADQITQHVGNHTIFEKGAPPNAK